MDPSVTDFIAREARFGARNYEPLGVVLSRGEGVFVWDTEGHRYLDCLSAYSAVNQGHCHPKILAAMVEQAGLLTLTSRAFHNDQLALFYEEIAALTGSHKVLPMNSGAEAVESAIKSVRKWGYEVKGVPDGQAEIIVCADNFHGRTLGIIGFSTDPAACDHFGPFAPGFKIIAFGDATALKKAITPNTVAFLVEPIQGEAGVVVPPSGYFNLGGANVCATENVAVSGRFNDAAVYIYGVCCSKMSMCNFDNYHQANPNAYALVFTANNTLSIASDYTTIATINEGTSDWLMERCELHCFRSGAGASGKALLLEGTTGIKFNNGQIASANGYLTEIKGGNALSGFDTVTPFYTDQGPKSTCCFGGDGSTSSLKHINMLNCYVQLGTGATLTAGLVSKSGMFVGGTIARGAVVSEYDLNAIGSASASVGGAIS